MKRVFVLLIACMCFTIKSQTQTVTDYEGNVYNTITIGTQTWMKENLKSEKYNDGTDIPLVTDSFAWINLTTPAYSYYYNDEATYKDMYGALYNYYVIKTGKICPIGWHVPTTAEWQTLLDYLSANGYNYDGTTVSNKVAIAMSEYQGWQYSTGMGCPGNDDYAAMHNSSGFSARPAGYRFPLNPTVFGSFIYATTRTGWWAGDTTTTNVVQIENSSSVVQVLGNLIMAGNSCRCIKDGASNVNHLHNNSEFKIYPNPATDYIFMRSDKTNSDYKIIICDILGNHIATHLINNNASKINLSNMQAGIYLLKIETGNEVVTKKFIKN